jgi:hypothetical protein
MTGVVMMISQDQRRRDGAAGNALVGASQITLVPALT